MRPHPGPDGGMAGREALNWIRTHPGAFLWLAAQRFANLWLGPFDRSVAAGGVFAA